MSPEPPVDAAGIARRQFSSARRGYRHEEVRDYLTELAGLITRLEERAEEERRRAEALEGRAGQAEGPAAEGEQARARADAEGEATLARAREQAEAVLAGAEAEAEQTLARARDEAEQTLARAGQDAEAVRGQARGDGEQVLATARQEAQHLVAEALAVREKLLGDLARRRHVARGQLERLNAARERLLAAYVVIRRTVEEATTELNASLPAARAASEQALRRAKELPEPTVEEVEAELSAARMAGLVDVSTGAGRDVDVGALAEQLQVDARPHLGAALAESSVAAEPSSSDAADDPDAAGDPGDPGDPGGPDDVGGPDGVGGTGPAGGSGPNGGAGPAGGVGQDGDVGPNGDAAGTGDAAVPADPGSSADERSRGRLVPGEVAGERVDVGQALAAPQENGQVASGVPDPDARNGQAFVLGESPSPGGAQGTTPQPADPGSAAPSREGDADGEEGGSGEGDGSDEGRGDGGVPSFWDTDAQLFPTSGASAGDTPVPASSAGPSGSGAPGSEPTGTEPHGTEPPGRRAGGGEVRGGEGTTPAGIGRRGSGRAGQDDDRRAKWPFRRKAPPAGEGLRLPPPAPTVRVRPPETPPAARRGSVGDSPASDTGSRSSRSDDPPPRPVPTRNVVSETVDPAPGRHPPPRRRQAGESDLDELFARVRNESVAAAGTGATEAGGDRSSRAPGGHGEGTEPSIEPGDAAVPALARGPEAVTDRAAAQADAARGPAAPEESADAGLLRARDAALDRVETSLSRLLKRALADEQNEVLDRVRRSMPAGIDQLVPDHGTHVDRFATVARPRLEAAAGLGAELVGGRFTGSCAALATQMGDALVEPLRQRLARSIEEGDDPDEVTDRLRALYREWKGQRIGIAVRHHTAAAYAAGALDGTQRGTELRWLVDRSGEPCPDADDNALARGVCKGQAFPTGDRCPPAHPGCRCLVVPAGRPGP